MINRFLVVAIIGLGLFGPVQDADAGIFQRLFKRHSPRTTTQANPCYCRYLYHLSEINARFPDPCDRNRIVALRAAKELYCACLKNPCPIPTQPQMIRPGVRGIDCFVDIYLPLLENAKTDLDRYNACLAFNECVRLNPEYGLTPMICVLF
jgi:hypothetical protein